MQLHLYIQILMRAWYIVLSLPLLVGAASLFNELQQPPRYAATARVMVSHESYATLPPYTGPLADVQSFADYNITHSWHSSSFILDDVPQVISSLSFARDVSEILAANRIELSPAAIRGALQADVLHRSVTINAVAGTPEQAQAIAQGAIAALEANGLKYWNRDDTPTGGLRVAVIDPVTGAAPLQSTRGLVVSVGLRTGLALGVGVGLAFLLSYLDTTLHTRRQVEEILGVAVLGSIPDKPIDPR